jgi:hypothetical protein
MQGKIFAYKKLKYFKHTKEKLFIETLCRKVWLEKKTFKKIFSYTIHKGIDF